MPAAEEVLFGVFAMIPWLCGRRGTLWINMKCFVSSRSCAVNAWSSHPPSHSSIHSLPFSEAWGLVPKLYHLDPWTCWLRGRQWWDGEMWEEGEVRMPFHFARPPVFNAVLCFSFFLAALRGSWDFRFPKQRWNPGPWQWKHWVLTTGLPGDCLMYLSWWLLPSLFTSPSC